MFAVIKTGGKQYKVAKDDVLIVEKLAAEAGETIQFNDVLMLGGEGDVTVGSPFVDGAGVQAEVMGATRGPKLINLKRRRRKHSSRRKKGHRQDLTKVKVLDILASGADASGVKAALGAGSVSVAAVAAAAPAEAPAKAEKAAKAEAPAAVEEAPAVVGVKPSNLLEAADGEADDLTKISGVGPKLLEKLNANGIYHFRQIAEWTAEEIAYIDVQLSFKGRIERDGWIEQAKQYAAEAGSEAE